MAFPIFTEHLIIRRWVESDWKDMVEYTTDEAVARYEFWDEKRWAQKEEVVQWIRSQTGLAMPTLGTWVEFALELKQKRKVIGDIGLKYLSEQNKVAEVGWTLNRNYQKKGYATEAAEAFITFCFSSMNLHRVVSRCDARNTDSYRLMERLGFRREAHHIRSSFVKGEWCDEFVYAILDTEWKSKYGS